MCTYCITLFAFKIFVDFIFLGCRHRVIRYPCRQAAWWLAGLLTCWRCTWCLSSQLWLPGKCKWLHVHTCLHVYVVLCPCMLAFKFTYSLEQCMYVHMQFVKVLRFESGCSFLVWLEKATATWFGLAILAVTHVCVTWQIFVMRLFCNCV